jgi:hypothetical protein
LRWFYCLFADPSHPDWLTIFVAFDESSLQWVDAVLFLMALFETLREYTEVLKIVVA